MKTKRNLKRILSVILTVLMIMSTLVVGVVSVSAYTYNKPVYGQQYLYVDISAYTSYNLTGINAYWDDDHSEGDIWYASYTDMGNYVYRFDLASPTYYNGTIGENYKNIRSFKIQSGGGDMASSGTEYNCIKITGSTTREWSTYGGSSGGDTRTVYLNNTAGWTTLNAYTWSGSGDTATKYTGEYPGTAMTLVEGNIYKIDVPTSATNIIFNDKTTSDTYNKIGDLNLTGLTIGDQTDVSFLTSDLVYDNSKTDDTGWSIYGSGGETGTTWYVSGLFGQKHADGTETVMENYNMTATNLPMTDVDNDGIYEFNTGYTYNELKAKSGWFLRFYDGNSEGKVVYSAEGTTAKADIVLGVSDAVTSTGGTKYATELKTHADGDKGWLFEKSTDSSEGIVTLYLDTTGTTPVFYFTITEPTVPGAYTVKSDTIINGKVDISNSNTGVTTGTANEGDVITVTHTAYGSYFSLNTLTYSYETKDAAGKKVTNTVDIDKATMQFTMPAAKVTVNATFKLDKAAYIATQGDGLWIDVAPDKTDTMSTLIKWNNYTGTGTSGNHDTTSTYTFYVPSGVDLTNATVYNGFGEAVTLNNVSIPADNKAVVNLTAGSSYTTSNGANVKVMQGSTDSMFLYTSDGKGTDYDLPTNVLDSRIKELVPKNSDIVYDKDSIKAKGGDCVTMSGGAASATMALEQVKGRGNSSWKASTELFGKYAFNMKFASKQALLGMDKCKSWCLLANNVDMSMMRNALTYGLAADVGIQNSPKYRFVDIYDNGEYMGAYLVTDKVDVGSSKLVKGESIDDIHDAIAAETGVTVDKTTKKGSFSTAYGTVYYKCANVGLDSSYDSAYLNGGTYNGDKYNPGTFLLEFEIAKRVDMEASWFQTPKGQYVVVKSPEFATEAELKYIAEKYVAMENAAYNSASTVAELSNYMDVDSFAQVYLIQELSANLDSAATSYYLTYSITDGKFVASPVWDYDWAYAQHSGSGKIGVDADENGTSYTLNNNMDYNAGTGWWARYKNIGDSDEVTTKRNIQAVLANNTNFQTVIKKVWNGSSDASATNAETGFYKVLQTYYGSGGYLDTWETQIGDSVAMNENRWGFIAGNQSSGWGTVQRGTTATFEANVEYLQNTWVKQRAEWLNTEINKFTDYEQVAAPTLTLTNAAGETVANNSAFTVNTALTLTANTTESFVTYNFYDGDALLGSNTTGTLTVTPNTTGTHTYSVNTVYGTNNTKTSNTVTATAAETKAEGVAITNITLHFKGTNLNYLNPSLKITDSTGAVVMAETALTKGTYIGTHFEGSYRFYWYDITINSLTVGNTYTFTFTTNGSNMNATVTPDLNQDWFYTGSNVYFAVDNMHSGTKAVDITNNDTAKTSYRNAANMISNNGGTATASVNALYAGISTADVVYTLGDVDKNGKLDITDAAAVQLKLAKLADSEDSDSLLGDFNIDGEFNILDAAAIQLSLAKLY